MYFKGESHSWLQLRIFFELNPISLRLLRSEKPMLTKLYQNTITRQIIGCTALK